MPKPITTRTLNPLPFDALEPKRFEDLVRQLVYDFRFWRTLEATGRAGSDDGFDARGFEDAGDEDIDQYDENDDKIIPVRLPNRIWLIQCKRERVVGPSKMRGFLNNITQAEAKSLYGVIFAVACDLSKSTRDVMHAWSRENGIAETHLWGRGEIEDQLFQPKNDNLLFAYFGISLQIRKRSQRSELRSMLTMKRKVYRHLGSSENGSRTVLLRDPAGHQYPYIEGKLENCPWYVTEFGGNHAGYLRIRWRSYYGFLDDDARHWDIANVQNGSPTLDFENAWLEQDERIERRQVDNDIHQYWLNEIPENRRAIMEILGYFRYEDILEIDESGDEVAPFPHLYVPFKKSYPDFTFVSNCLSVSSRAKGGKLEDPIECWNPDKAFRVAVFPTKFRKPLV